MSEVGYSSGVSEMLRGVLYKIVTENTVFDLCVLYSAVLTVENSDHAALLAMLVETVSPVQQYRPTYCCTGRRGVGGGGWPLPHDYHR